MEYASEIKSIGCANFNRMCLSNTARANVTNAPAVKHPNDNTTSLLRVNSILSLLVDTVVPVLSIIATSWIPLGSLSKCIAELSIANTRKTRVHPIAFIEQNATNRMQLSNLICWFYPERFTSPIDSSTKFSKRICKIYSQRKFTSDLAKFSKFRNKLRNFSLTW